MTDASPRSNKLIVVERFDFGVQAESVVDSSLLRNRMPQRLNLSVADKAALAAVLGILDDTALLTDAKIFEPDAEVREAHKSLMVLA